MPEKRWEGALALPAAQAPRFDVAIVGASFAGLAVANALIGHRVLVVDRHPAGSHQTSACGTMLQVLRYWELPGTVLQTHRSLCLHIADKVIEFPSPYPWCIFDYGGLCQRLLERSGADFLEATVYGLEDNRLFTSDGIYRARCLVDASGWRAALVSDREPGYVRPQAMNFGNETISPFSKSVGLKQSALHFWYEPVELSAGVGWAFPRGNRISVGLASYRRAMPVSSSLEHFARELTVQPDGFHGTYFPHTIRKPVAGKVFVVGDAAGMCPGLTGEGIRPALYFGEACGAIIRRVLDGDLLLDKGLALYGAFVRQRRPFFRFFTSARHLLNQQTGPRIRRFAQVIHVPGLRKRVFDGYWQLTREWGSPN